MKPNKYTKTQIFELVFNGYCFDDNVDLIFPVKESIINFDDEELKKGYEVSRVWPTNAVLFVTGTKTVDYFRYSAYNIISERIKVLFHKYIIKGIEYLPITLINNDQDLTFNKYWAINILKIIDGLDKENTNWGKRGRPQENDKYSHLRIIKPAIKSSSLNIEDDIFLLSVFGKIKPNIYISKKIKDLLIDNDCAQTIVFMPIRVV
jgi:hypothetical protein